MLSLFGWEQFCFGSIRLVDSEMTQYYFSQISGINMDI